MSTESESHDLDQSVDPMCDSPVAISDKAEDKHCPGCGRPLSIDSLAQFCPYCLLATDVADPAQTGSLLSRRNRTFAPPKIEELQPFFPSLDIISLIGHGGMGAVYRAHQRSLDRDVALKILPPEVAATEGFVERFLREARALARLGHPNIVAVYDHGTAGPYAYLVIELVEGINLRDLIAGDRLPPQEVFRIVPQLCDALQFAHSRGVIHRDIKPENILIDETGQVKITDFGLAKLTESEGDLAHTATRQVMGTVHYMAPEQIERPKEVDHRADLYSLGVVFYELLTGELPIGRFSPPSEKAGTPRQVDKVVFKSLEKEPARRYASAAEVRDDLDRGQRSASASGAQAAARAVDQGIRTAGNKVMAAASELAPGGRGLLTALATIAFYVVGIGGGLLFAAAGAVGYLSVFVVLLFLAAHGLKKLYRAAPLPESLSPLDRPVNWMAELTSKLSSSAVSAARSVEGIRLPWMVTALCSCGFGIYLLALAVAIDDDLAFGAVIALLAGFFLTRIAVPTGVSPRTRSARIVTFAPIVVVLIPVVLAVLLSPIFVWLAMVIDGTPPSWFTDLTGLNQSLPRTIRSGNIPAILSVLFGGLAFQFGWLASLSLLNAISPATTKWFARPVLNDWDGRFRWWILIVCAFAFVISGLAFVLFSGA